MNLSPWVYSLEGMPLTTDSCHLDEFPLVTSVFLLSPSETGYCGHFPTSTLGALHINSLGNWPYHSCRSGLWFHTIDLSPAHHSNNALVMWPVTSILLNPLTHSQPSTSVPLSQTSTVHYSFLLDTLSSLGFQDLINQDPIKKTESFFQYLNRRNLIQELDDTGDKRWKAK